MAVTAPELRPIPSRRTIGRAQRWSWIFQRVSGLVLIVLVFTHLFFNLILGGGVSQIATTTYNAMQYDPITNRLIVLGSGGFGTRILSIDPVTGATQILVTPAGPIFTVPNGMAFEPISRLAVDLGRPVRRAISAAPTASSPARNAPSTVAMRDGRASSSPPSMVAGVMEHIVFVPPGGTDFLSEVGGRPQAGGTTDERNRRWTWCNALPTT